jgi:broad specificity phosphatase PhoE
MSGFLLLCRHGNTFNRGDKVVTVGARHDLELTDEGREQAVAVARALVKEQVIISRVIAGQLKRTRVFAEIILKNLPANLIADDVTLKIDPRLLELDYGPWEGLSDLEIKAKWGEQALLEWQDLGKRPEAVNFIPSAEKLEQEIQQILSEQAKLAGVSLLVTSNGRLREFSRVLGQGTKKVKTGHICVLKRLDAAEWEIAQWGVGPLEMRLA